ncbi:MAG: 1-deoxy-D-xylulose-5-phosphate reductoisomerase, partial [Clostridia bacterium]|nr:1-deoxy-D-xylulose-5-phosphate reductoisomerase [Clostridia bacterium]
MIDSISVLGSTGSVGKQTLAVAERLNIPVKSISGNRNIELLEQQARRFMPEFVCVFDEGAAKKLKIALADTDIKVGSGMSALVDSACSYAPCVVTAVSGSVGLLPTLAAIDEGRRIALANKETLVCGGEIVMRRARESGAEIIPVDSEHSAIFQCLEAQGRGKALKRILLTGSGGPFRGKSCEETRNATPAMAVSHPNWNMGAKISVDSATMMNKGLEFIEAMHLFSVAPDEIKVIINTESII